MVTQNRECNLGKIISAKMILSDFGKIVETEWLKSFQIRNELILHEFVIMPNHLHAIVEINNGIIVIGGDTVDTHGRVYLPFTPVLPINPDYLIDNELLCIKRNHPIRLPKSISSFIAGFKSAVNTNIDDYIDKHKLSIPKYNRKNHFFQPNYHDNIIRDNNEYQRIQNYILNNPKNWILDKLNDNNF
jgi:REP element-mobilizing transposase RayT